MTAVLGLGRDTAAPAGSVAAAPDTPPALRATPDALVYGHAANVYLQILTAGRLDGDGAADLIVGELPTGLHGDERTESNLLLGRITWPARAGTEALGSRKIVEPVQNDRDRFAYLGSGDLDGDGRDDLVTVTIRQPGTAGQTVRLGLHWSPETWASRPDLSRPDVALEVPSKVVPNAAKVGDIDGDGAADLLATGENGVDILRGRAPWPATLPLDPPDIRIGPQPAAIDLADATGDGRADLWLTYDQGGIDAALVTGRASWPATVDAPTEADLRLGTGGHHLGGRIVPDLTGDGLADALRIDHAASAFGVYHGGPDLVARLTAQTADWAVTGITDTYRVEAMDLTGDSVAELLLDRHAVIVGRAGRHGTVDISAGDYDAEWPGLGERALRSLDVDGQRGDDVLVGDSGANVPGRRGAGTIGIFLSPLFTPDPRTPPPPTLTPTPTGGSPTATATPGGMAPTATAVASPSATPGGGIRRVWLPVTWSGQAVRR